MSGLLHAEKLLNSVLIPNYLDIEHEDEFSEGDGEPVRDPREVSRPYVLTVIGNNTGIPLVRLFNASVNLSAVNYGNNANINIVYDYPNMTYGGFLATTVDEPFKLNKVRVEADDFFNIPDNLQFTETQYIGDSDTTTHNTTEYLDQYYQNAIEFETNQLITSTKQVSFYLNFTAFKVTQTVEVLFKFFPEYIFTVGRRLRGLPYLREFRQVNTIALRNQARVYGEPEITS